MLRNFDFLCRTTLRRIACGLALSCVGIAAQASPWQRVCPGIEATAENSPDAQSLEVFVSPYTHHWTDSEEHRPVKAVSISRLLPNTRFCGFSLFTNSFGQPSAYAFTGKYWPKPFESAPGVYLSVSGGIMYGYVGRYKNKVPLNVGGFSPVIIPAVGFRLNSRSAIEVQVLGTAALMFGATWRY